MLSALLALEGLLAVDVHAYGEYGFRLASEYGHVGCMAQLLVLTGPRRVHVHVHDEWAFRLACREGHLPAVDVLLGLDGDRRLDVNAEDGAALRWACRNNQVAVAVRLLALDNGRTVDVHLGGEAALREASTWRRRDTMRLLLAATGEHAPSPASVKKLGLRTARTDAIWAGSALRGGRGVMVQSRVARRRAARAARERK